MRPVARVVEIGRERRRRRRRERRIARQPPHTRGEAQHVHPAEHQQQPEAVRHGTHVVRRVRLIEEDGQQDLSTTPQANATFQRRYRTIHAAVHRSSPSTRNSVPKIIDSRKWPW